MAFGARFLLNGSMLKFKMSLHFVVMTNSAGVVDIFFFDLSKQRVMIAGACCCRLNFVADGAAFSLNRTMHVFKMHKVVMARARRAGDFAKIFFGGQGLNLKKTKPKK
jgi:hypothetical protein